MFRDLNLTMKKGKNVKKINKKKGKAPEIEKRDNTVESTNDLDIARISYNNSQYFEGFLKYLNLF